MNELQFPNASRVLVSIDFDFFVPERDIWDLGHREAELFLKAMWMFRGRYMEEMKTNDVKGTYGGLSDQSEEEKGNFGKP
jgi:hypothetical protein